MSLKRMTVNKRALMSKEPAVRIKEDGEEIRFAQEVLLKGPSRLWCPILGGIVLDTESEIEEIKPLKIEPITRNRFNTAFPTAMNSMKKTLRDKKELEGLDWATASQPGGHPVQIKIDQQKIYALDTGEVVATVAEGYQFYWAHGHAHIAKEGWDGVAGEGHFS